MAWTNHDLTLDEKDTKKERLLYSPNVQKMLEDWCIDAEVRGALHVSLKALGELLRGFNETIYKHYIEPTECR